MKNNSTTSLELLDASSRSGDPGTGVKTELIKVGGSVLKSVLTVVVVGGTLALAYYLYTHRFKKWPYDNDLPDANVSESQAKARATTIAKSLALFGDDFDAVATALSGLNSNGFVRVYNAFGKYDEGWGQDDTTLVEFLNKHYSQYQVSQLSALLNGAFF